MTTPMTATRGASRRGGGRGCRAPACRPAVSSRFRPRPSTGSAPTPANGEAVARLYAAKGRPAFNPLIAHVAAVAAAARLPRFDPTPSGSRRVLAGAADAGPAKAAGCPVAELGDRRARHHRRARAEPHVARDILTAFGDRWRRPRPTAPAMCRRPRRRTCWPIWAGAST